jgi:Uncharacterized conserved protein
VRLEHILEAARTIARFTARFDSAGSLLADEAAFWLVVHMIEIIGEAAGRISAETRAQLPLPWVEIISMRNRLTHGYFEINDVIIWRTATLDVPALANAIDAFLEREERGE